MISGSRVWARLLWVPWHRVSHKATVKMLASLLYLRAQLGKIHTQIHSCGGWQPWGPSWLLTQDIRPLLCRSLHRAAYHMGAGFPQSKQESEREPARRKLVHGIPTSEVTSHHSWHVLFVGRGGDYTRVWVPRGEDNEEPFQRVDTDTRELPSPAGLLLLQSSWVFLWPFL